MIWEYFLGMQQEYFIVRPSDMKTYTLSLLILLLTDSFSFGQNWSWLNQVSGDVDIRNWVLADSSMVLISGATCREIVLIPDLIEGVLQEDDCYTLFGQHPSSNPTNSFYALLDQQTGEVLHFDEFNGVNILDVDYHDSTILLGGLFRDTIVIGNESYISNGGEDWILISLNVDRTINWVKTGGSNDREFRIDFVVDQQGNCYFSTYIRAAFSMDSQAFDPGAILGKIDPAGNFLWLDQPKGSSFSRMAVDEDGNLIVGGAFRDSILLDSILAHATGVDQFIAKYDSTGQAQWIQTFGGYYSDDFLGGLAVDQANRIYIVGQSSRDSYFGDSLYSSTLLHQGFLLQFDTDGNLLQMIRDSLSMSYYTGIQVSSDNQIYLVNELSTPFGYPGFYGDIEVYLTVLDSSFQPIQTSLPFKVRDRPRRGENWMTGLQLNHNDEVYLSRRYFRHSIFNNVWSNAYDHNSFIGKLSMLDFTTVVDFPFLLATDSNTPELAIQLSPNPVKDHFSIQLDHSLHEQIDISVLNLTGQVIHEIKGYRHGSSISAMTWEAGIYLIRIHADGRQWTKKLIKH